MTIGISYTCFGPNVTINGNSVCVDSQNRELDEIEENKAKAALLGVLISIKETLDTNDWAKIAEIVVANKPEMNLVEDSEYHCEQCGSYNKYSKYEG